MTQQNWSPHSYRPNDVDARDPRFRAALDQAAHDPDLARWFNQQRIFDTFIANRLAETRPPADLLVVIVAGLENGHGGSGGRWTYILAFGAVLGKHLVRIDCGPLYMYLLSDVSSALLL